VGDLSEKMWLISIGSEILPPDLINKVRGLRERPCMKIPVPLMNMVYHNLIDYI